MYSPFKMKGKSPMMKALIGKQKNLPEQLKAKILAAPDSPAKMMKKSPTKMKKESMAKKSKIVTGTTVFGKKVTGKGVARATTALATGGISEVVRAAGKMQGEKIPATKPKKMKKDLTKKTSPSRMMKKSPTKMAKKSPAKVVGLKEKLAAQREKRAKGMKSGKVSLSGLNERIQKGAANVSRVLKGKNKDGTSKGGLVIKSKKNETTGKRSTTITRANNTDKKSSATTPPAVNPPAVNPPASKGKVTYKQAWDKMSVKAKKKYTDFAQFKKAAEDYNKKKKKQGNTLDQVNNQKKIKP